MYYAVEVLEVGGAIKVRHSSRHRNEGPTCANTPVDAVEKRGKERVITDREVTGPPFRRPS